MWLFKKHYCRCCQEQIETQGKTIIHSTHGWFCFRFCLKRYEKWLYKSGWKRGEVPDDTLSVWYNLYLAGKERDE